MATEFTLSDLRWFRLNVRAEILYIRQWEVGESDPRYESINARISEFQERLKRIDSKIIELTAINSAQTSDGTD